MSEFAVCFVAGCAPPFAGIVAFLTPFFVRGYIAEYRKTRKRFDDRVAEHALLMSIWRQQL